MIQCPTCKTDARPSAKFCTFCGTTLAPLADEPLPVADDASAVNEVLERPSNDAVARWNAPHPTPESRDVAAGAAGQDQLISTTWPSEEERGNVPDHRTLGNGDSAWPVADEASTELPATERFAAPADATASAQPDAAQPSMHSHDGVGFERATAPASVAEPPTEWRLVPSADEPATIDVPAAAGDRDLEGDASAEVAEFAVATLPVESDLASRSEPLADADADAPYGKEDEAVRAPMAAFTATPEAIETSDAPPSFAAALVAGAVDPARRAADLLDELRAVLPALGATRLQPAALADRLQGTLETDGEVPQGLRAALDAARRNPRDIDTMLELTQRIDDVVILIDRHDRIRDEVASAIRSLRYGEVE